MAGLVLGMFALAFGVSSAGAVVAKIGGHTYGITPVNGVNAAGLAGVKRAQRASGVSATSPLPYDKAEQLISHGGPVMHSVTTHVIYWDPGGEFLETTKGIFKKFFTDVAHDSGLASNVFAVAGQYTDSTGNAAYSSTATTEQIDKHSYPSTGNCTTPEGVHADPGPYSECLFDEQLQGELSTYIEKEGLLTGPTQLYFLLLPHKVVSCLPEEDPEIHETACSNNAFCAYHSSIEGSTTSKEILYADIPFSLLDSGGAKGCQFDGNSAIQLPNGDATGTTRFADVALKYTSHEYIEAATDPLGNAWWENLHKQEIGDKCNLFGIGSEPGEDPNAFMPTLGGSKSPTLFDQSIAGDSYYLQSEWDNTAKACLMKPLPITAAGFTPAAESTIVGSVVNFEAKATDPYGHMVFAWNFGDGETSIGPSPSHEYKARSKYTVTMTPTDELTGSTAAPVHHTVTVKSTQTISFTSTTPSAATVGGSTYTATATATSGLIVSFSSGTPSVCSVAGSTVSFLAVGVCTIDAEQAGNEEFVAGPEAQQSFTVGRAPTQTVPSEFEVVSSKEALGPPAPTPSGIVALLGTRLSIGASGAGSVRLSCTGTAACSGSLTLTVKVKAKGKHARTLTLGSASFSIAAGATGTVTLKLNAAGRSQLRAAHGHLGAILTIVKSSPAPAGTQARGVRLKQKLKK